MGVIVSLLRQQRSDGGRGRAVPGCSFRVPGIHVGCISSSDPLLSITIFFIDDLPFLDHETVGPHRLDILEGIPVEGQDAGFLVGGDGTGAVVHACLLSWVVGYAPDDFCDVVESLGY